MYSPMRPTKNIRAVSSRPLQNQGIRFAVQNDWADEAPQKDASLTPSTLFMLAAAASFVNLLLYSLFYKFSAVIWSLNVPFSVGKLLPHIRPWVSQEGIRGYMLYVLTFADIALTLALSRILVRIGRLGVAAAAAATPVLILCYYSSIDFYPPVREIAYGSSLAISLVAVSLVIAASLIIYKIRGGMLTAFFAVILLPVCFVTTAPISQADYCFTIGPALRMLHRKQPFRGISPIRPSYAPACRPLA